MTEEYPPRCPGCGVVMTLSASIPRSGDLPAVEGYVCRPCRRQLTVEVDEEVDKQE